VLTVGIFRICSRMLHSGRERRSHGLSHPTIPSPGNPPCPPSCCSGGNRRSSQNAYPFPPPEPCLSSFCAVHSTQLNSTLAFSSLFFMFICSPHSISLQSFWYCQFSVLSCSVKHSYIVLFALIFYVDAGNNTFVAIPTGEVM
jgi:hypothetical protein